VDVNAEIEYHKHVPELEEPPAPTAPEKFREYAEAPHRTWKPLHRFLGFIHEARPATLLEIGCGAGQLTTRLAKTGYRVTALELSPELVAATRRRAELDGVAERIEAVEANLETYDPGERRFDLVVAKLVLHHVRVEKALDVIVKALKPGGVAVVWEPVAFCPWLQKFRDLMPVKKDISPNERQLNQADLEMIAARFERVQMEVFYLLGRVRRLLPAGLRAGGMMAGIEKLDAFLLRNLPCLRPMAGTMVLRCQNPITDPARRAERQKIRHYPQLIKGALNDAKLPREFPLTQNGS